jgi:hypothetical protein
MVDFLGSGALVCSRLWRDCDAFLILPAAAKMALQPCNDAGNRAIPAPVYQLYDEFSMPEKKISG